MPPLVADLRLLLPTQRVVMILERAAELPSVMIADVLQVPVDDVLALARQARAELVSRNTDRADDQALAAEFRAAVPPELATAYGAAADLDHGRQLVRRRRLRRGLTGATALGLLIAGVLVLLPGPRRPPSARRHSCRPRPRLSV